MRLPFVLCVLLCCAWSCVQTPVFEPREEVEALALKNGADAREALIRCRDYMTGWLSKVDPETGLLPRRLPWKEGYRNVGPGDSFWNLEDSAADNYPFLVLTSALIDRQVFEGQMLQILETERRLTTRFQGLPDAYSFEKRAFLRAEVDFERLVFGSSEYIKDGLLPVTEWLGPSPWSDRLIELLGRLWEDPRIETPYGAIPSTNLEINGEMMQVLSRIYWMTGDRRYLEWAIRLADFYLLGQNHPTRDLSSLRLRDHGCEVVSGLCEVYLTVSFADSERKNSYREPLYEMLDRILEVGRNEDGLFYNVIGPVSGQVLNSGVSDSWGYNLNGFYAVYLVDGVERYRDAVLRALMSLDSRYRSFDWESGSADGYADSIEGALNLFNREPVDSAGLWIDREIRNMWVLQKEDGIIEGWHGDGNFARTSLMYALWKTGGVTVHPWSEGLSYGSVIEEDGIYVTLESEEGWEGEIHFDRSRHKDYFNLPLDWPRINQFPEWFTVSSQKRYRLTIEGAKGEIIPGRALIDGRKVVLEPGGAVTVFVTELD